MIKATLFLIVSVFIILKPAELYKECNTRTALQAETPVIWFEQTIDGSNQKPAITRFYHNKVTIFGQELSKCYFDKLSPNFFFETGGIFCVIFLVYLFFYLTNTGNWVLLILLFLLPFLPALTLNSIISNKITLLISYLYRGLAVAGINIFLFKRDK